MHQKLALLAQEMSAARNNGASYLTLDNTASATTWVFVHENAAPNRLIITEGVNDGPMWKPL